MVSNISAHPRHARFAPSSLALVHHRRTTPRFAAVARGRGRMQSTVKNGFGKGGMVRAKEAVDEGMADKVGTLEDVLSRYGLSVADVSPAASSDRAEIEIRKQKLLLRVS